MACWGSKARRRPAGLEGAAWPAGGGAARGVAEAGGRVLGDKGGEEGRQEGQDSSESGEEGIGGED